MLQVLENDALHDIEPLSLAVREIGPDFGPVHFLKEQPRGITEPEERSTIRMLQVATVA
jgi:hypothetical protein